LVIGDGEAERLRLVAVEALHRLDPHAKSDSLLEVGLIDRVRESDGGDHFLDLGVGRVLIELGGID
jgi:hypothetical protein